MFQPYSASNDVIITHLIDQSILKNNLFIQSIQTTWIYKCPKEKSVEPHKQNSYTENLKHIKKENPQPFIN
jgi:hypothetical protein